MSAPRPSQLPAPPPGILFLRKRDDVFAHASLHAYQHSLLRAWEKLGLSGVLVIRGIPTVYLREDDAALPPAQVHELQKAFWNQGVATLLVLVDRKKTRVISGMVPPERLSDADRDKDESIDRFTIELNLAGQALRAHRAEDGADKSYKDFCRQVASGQFYRLHAPKEKFNPGGMVDAHLLKSLGDTRNALTRGANKLSIGTAHAFLGRLLFTCYLVDRGIVNLGDDKYFGARGWTRLQQVIEVEGGFEEVLDRLYVKLFLQLKDDFNGSMFDGDNLNAERAAIRPEHLSAVRDFFGAHDVAKKQQQLGFWRYDFSFIPVETISAIYENFLVKESEEKLNDEGKNKKREDGAYYTPRLLAEMTLDLAMEGRATYAGGRYLDPACGSGIFLVLLFNRLAAEWTAKNPEKAASTKAAAFRAKDKALRAALGALRGVDKNPTACRIACFSLYLAFLDQFDPNDIREYIAKTDDKLPNILRQAGGRGHKPAIPVIWEGSFFDIADEWEKSGERFTIIAGNPPWAGRGTKQIAQEFMKRTPALLSSDGKASLLLPTKVFFNKTDTFQSQWLRQVTLEKVVQLSDYRFLLFTGAICPCLIARFTAAAPDEATRRIEYLTPKVTRSELRQGAIPIAPTDRKEIPLRVILGACEQKAATMAWKSHFWGTPRDLKFLNHLYALPRLGEQVDLLSRAKQKRKHPWVAGQGGKPWSLESKSEPDRELRPFDEAGDKWAGGDSFVRPSQIDGLALLPAELCGKLGDYFKAKKLSLTHLYSKPSPELFRPPAVIFNQGFTNAAFFDYPIRFQHSLQSIAGAPGDADALLFLTAYLRSRLARYFVFQTSSSLGTERDRVLLDEVLNLPFFLPDDPESPQAKVAEALMGKVVGKLRSLEKQMKADAEKFSARLHPKTFRLQHADEGNEEQERAKWLSRWRKKTADVQAEVEPLIYEYFGLIGQEQALVDDCWEIFDKSDTPGSFDTAMPTLEPIAADGMEAYATTLAETLKSWSLKGSLATRITAGVDTALGIGVLRVERTKSDASFRTAPLSTDTAAAVKRIEEAATTTNGTLVYVRDETWWFDGPTIILAKPALRGRWSRTAALNDAAEIYATIQHSRRGNA